MVLGIRLALAGALIATLGCGSSDGGATERYAGYQSEIYGSLGPWLCHPAQDAADNVCLGNLDATSVAADGAATLEPHMPAANPPIDCFYIYPTASADNAGNSDLEANEEEVFIVRNQAARFNSVCRVFAPVHRQVTLSVIFNDALVGDGELAYGDVVDRVEPLC